MKRSFGLILATAVLLVVGLGGNKLLTRNPPPRAKVEDVAPSEGHGAHGDAVALDEAKVAAGGIQLETAGPARLRNVLQLNGTIQANQEALVQVTPRFPGVVRSLRKRIGDSVVQGETVAIVESNQSLTNYELKAPIDGTVIERQAALGEFVSEQKPVVIIANLEKVWVDFSIFRRDLGRVSIGDRLLIDAEDDKPAIEARISYVSPLGSSDTQTGLARATVPNIGMRLRPGLFVSARLMLADKPVGLAVKTSALQTFESKMVVFVREGQRFEARSVVIGARDSEWVEILSGLSLDETYAAENSFVVKSEMGKGAAAHDD